MNLQQLVEAVFANTNRPDLVLETSNAIQRATLKLHTVDHFARDLQLTQINIAKPGFDTVVDLAQFPQFRRVSRIETACRQRITPIDHNHLFDHKNARQKSYYYIRGTMLVIKTERPISSFMVDYLSYPITQPFEQYNSWIAAGHHAYAIVDEATVTIAASIGNSNLAQQFRALVGSKSVPDSHIHRLISDEPLVSDVDLWENNDT